ncbi:hypothetical protein NSK_005830 [Nannochloropsis salina CCMP1776]|uniref:Protein kinase domain-containing protein n=1 Tax=Nannochloropsis salina CCMP1776 TaxID=1027361 RepID=A0A4D9CXG9_9STRA|nr:hypothetical protein NSK_005830 [Nannochloropsis salina CCMP1776]|eukprot:TFJ82877.1 hypothetical protein NSK_005830 [Nannochloropsis salina CCMP1776]
MDSADADFTQAGFSTPLTISFGERNLKSPFPAPSTRISLPTTPKRDSSIVLAPMPLELPTDTPSAELLVLAVRLSPGLTPQPCTCLLPFPPSRSQPQTCLAPRDSSRCTTLPTTSQTSRHPLSEAYLLLKQLTKPRDRVRLWLAQVLQEESEKEGGETTVYTPVGSKKVVIKESDASFIRAYGQLWGEDPVAEAGALLRIGQSREVAMETQAHGDEHVIAVETVFEGAGSSRGLLFMVMPYLVGEELFYRVTKTAGHEGLGEDGTRPIFRQIVQGLLHLKKAHGIRHGDVSPENVMVGPDGHVTLIDLGMAERVPSLPPSLHPSSSVPPGVLLRARPRRGKKQYMAPEIFEERDYDPYAADVWALGALLYVCWTGCTIYRSATDVQFAALKDTAGMGGLQKLLAEREFSGRTRSLSAEAKDLLCRMMVWDLRERMTLEEVAAHPWVLASAKEWEAKEWDRQVEVPLPLFNSSSVSAPPVLARKEITQQGGFSALSALSVGNWKENVKEEGAKDDEDIVHSRTSSSTTMSTYSKQVSNNSDDNSVSSLRFSEMENLRNNFNNNNYEREVDWEKDLGHYNRDEQEGDTSRSASVSSSSFQSRCSSFVGDDERAGEERETRVRERGAYTPSDTSSWSS